MNEDFWNAVTAQAVAMRKPPAAGAPLIGLIGKARAGKDTFARALVERHGFKRYAFADPLKRSILHLDPYIPATPMPGDPAPIRPIRLSHYVEAMGWELAKDNPEVRRLLQDHGVSIREHVDGLAWVTATMTPVAKTRADGTPVVITDVRFPNEVEAIREAGGQLVRIWRPGQPDTGGHVSENALNDYRADHTVYNDADEPTLWSRASVAYELLCEPR